jgi:hypothetical protein
MARFNFSLATSPPCHSIVTARRRELEHVFVAETAVAAGNGCIGCLGVLWLLLGDGRPCAEVNSDEARTHRVTVTASTVLATKRLVP